MRIAETFDLTKVVELALKLKDSDQLDAAMLAAGTLELEAAYGKLKNEYLKVVAENVSIRNSKLLARLAEEDTTKPTLRQRIFGFLKTGCENSCSRKV